MSDDTTSKVTWVAQPAHGFACGVDAVHGEMPQVEGSMSAVLAEVAALARTKLLLPSHAQLEVCVFVHREDGEGIERAIIATV